MPDIELRLQTYASELVGTHLKSEYDSQLSKWQEHIDRVGTAYTKAVEHHNKALADAKAKAAERNELTMAAMSFVAGVAFSWVGGYIQYYLSPKFFNMTPRYTASRVFGVWSDSFKAPYPHELVHTIGHVFGELPTEIKEFGADLILKPTDPREESDGGSLAGLLRKPDPDMLKLNLSSALRAEARKTSKAIGSLALDIINNQDYGNSCLKRLHRLNPGSERTSEHMREQLAKKMIVEDIDRQRRELATGWLYYGNDPVREEIDVMSDKIETEIWASWIIDQGFGDPVYSEGYGADDDVSFDDVVERFIDLDIAVARTAKQRTLQKARMTAEPDKVIPVTSDIDGPPDDSAGIYREIAGFVTWATNHAPDPLGGTRGVIKRDIGSILNVYKQ
jgi:hypothetical protein